MTAGGCLPEVAAEVAAAKLAVCWRHTLATPRQWVVAPPAMVGGLISPAGGYLACSLSSCCAWPCISSPPLSMAALRLAGAGGRSPPEPWALREEELVGGNGLVEMGTFLAILAGTIGAGIMMSSTHYAPIVATAIIAVAVSANLPAVVFVERRRKPAEMPLNWNSSAVLGTFASGWSRPRGIALDLGKLLFWFVALFT
ncbi:hypothetical protein FQR65_LT20740 [Abscondita terminalis]|nr:hypothetical protein FQR65_LT20740 [Abscondita terminalis]